MLRLRVDPAGVAGAEQVIEELVRQHLRRQRAVVPGPAHVALDALAERFLRDADLDRAEARIAADSGGDDLVDGRSAGAVAGERGTGGDAAHRLVVAVAGAGGIGRLVVQAAENVDVVAERGQRAEARREVIVGTGLAGNPIPLGDAVAVEPEDEAALDGFRRHAIGGIGRARGVEHAHQRRQTDLHRAAGQREPLKESPARHTEALSDYLRHSPLLPRETLWPSIIEIIIS